MTNVDGDLRPHFVLVPMMAQGHTIPMVDMAHLLAERGATVSFITTTLNAARLQPAIDAAAKSRLPIRFVPLHFPCAEGDLPEGTENIDTLSGRDQLRGFLLACSLLREPLVAHLRASCPPPSCIISDNIHPWTGDVARELGIPRLAFHGFGAFSVLCRYLIFRHKVFDGILDENEPVALPGFPHGIEISKAKAPANLSPEFQDWRQKCFGEEERADGVVVNSFYELETLYMESYQEKIQKKVRMIGPMVLCNRGTSSMAARGNKASIDEDGCLRWLGSMKPGSVIYVSFGSLARTNPAQLIEIGLGLESSKRPFVWAVKAGDKSPEIEEWFSEGFEERVRDRGLIIRGWAPQMLILLHPAVGGFMTHCGWNSTLEGISAGMPMITWPHFAEQFMNEMLIVEMMRIGVPIGVKGRTEWGLKNNKVIVKEAEVEAAVSMLMDGGEEGEERRRRARDLADKAKKAVEEGGSSYENTRLLIQQFQITNMKTEEQVEN